MSAAINPIRSDRAVSYRQSDGKLTILNFTFGAASPHKLLRADDAPARLTAAGLELVERHREAVLRRSLLAGAVADGCGLRTRLFAEDRREADERLMMAAASYRAALREVDPFAVLCLAGHCLCRWPGGRPGEIDVIRLDGRGPCEACVGCGRTRAFGPDAETCSICRGSGLSPSPAMLPKCVGDAIEAREARLADWEARPVAVVHPPLGHQAVVDAAAAIDF